MLDVRPDHESVVSDDAAAHLRDGNSCREHKRASRFPTALHLCLVLLLRRPSIVVLVDESFMHVIHNDELIAHIRDRQQVDGLRAGHLEQQL